MEQLTRRTLFKRSSMSLGVAGVVAALAACSPTNSVDTSQSTQVAGPAITQLNPPGEPIAVFVTDPAKGTLLIVHGNDEVTITNKEAAQLLLSLR